MASAEDVQQIIVMEWVRNRTNLPVIHVANQRQTSPQHGMLLKRMGVRPGVSDMFFPRSGLTAKGLWVELKTKTGKMTPLQIDFLEQMIEEGYAAEVAYGAEEAITKIKKFYDIR